MLDARNIGGAAFHERGADPVGTDDVFGVAEAGCETHPVQMSVQRQPACATLEDGCLTVSKNHAYSGTREAGFQPIENGRGHAGDAFLRVEIGPVDRREAVRGEPERLATSP